MLSARKTKKILCTVHSSRGRECTLRAMGTHVFRSMGELGVLHHG
jgi:hypothetical protein